MFKKFFKKLFQKRVAEEEMPIPDDKYYGNTAELFESIDRSFASSAAKVLYPDVDVEELSEEELDGLANIGYLFFLLARGFHASAEDVERLEKTGHF